MLKKLLTIVLPIAAPFIVYFIYAALSKRRELKLEDTPWPWLTAGGVALMAAVLIGWNLLSDPAKPGETIMMPRYEGGEVKPSEVIRE